MLTIVVIRVVLGTAIWVDQDARKLVASGATKAQLGGNSPLTWGIATILLWIIVFPWYLVNRGEVKRQLGIATNSTSRVSDTLTDPRPGPLPDVNPPAESFNKRAQRTRRSEGLPQSPRVPVAAGAALPRMRAAPPRHAGEF